MANQYTKSEPLFVTHPQLAKEWDYKKNAPLTPNDVTLGSRENVWWCCEYGHEWQTRIYHRIPHKSNKGTGCPICSGHKVLPGFNDIQTKAPELVKEWDFIKNAPLMPKDVTIGTHKKVWWKCEFGHEWQAQICDRVKGNKCPFCSGRGTSVPEQGIAFYLERVCEVEQRAKIDRKEIDVYLPEYKIGVEYDGRYFHGSKSKDREAIKDQALIKKGIKLIRIKESDINRIDDSNGIYFETDYLGPNYEWAIRQLCNLLVIYTGDTRFNLINICIQDDAIKIRNRINTYLKENSVLALRPDLAKEWNYDKNHSLKPDMFTLGAQTLLWWKCLKGHEWKSSISNRAKGNGCPYCSGRRPIKGQTDLKTLYPEVAKEWHPIKNEELTASDISPNYSKQVWWLCEHGHEWKISANSRISKKTGCPICAGRQVLEGFNDLATVHPEIAREWHPTRNGELTPKHVTCGSNKKAWWLCTVCGFEYQSRIGSKVNLGRGCPKCGRIKQVDSFINNRIVKEGTLKDNYPEIAQEWHPTKNGNLTPDDVLAKSNKKAWWKCDKGHEWQAVIANRSAGKGCPVCAGHQVLEGFNDLATINPELAKEWHPSKNGELKPNQVTSGSGKKVWWRCEYGHEWQATICRRISASYSSGTGCPVCSKKTGQIARMQTKIQLKGSLLDVNPEIAREWHPTKNAPLTPNQVTNGSGKKVWWKCSKNHEWQAQICCRAKGNNCPYCSDKARKKVLCVETNKVYESLSEASISVFGNSKQVTSISNVCKGRRHQTGGYHWKFL